MQFQHGSWLLIRQLSPSTTRHRRSILHFWLFWYISGHRSSPVNRACKILYFVFFWHPTIYFYLLSRKLATLWRLHSNYCFGSRSFLQFWTRFRQLQHPSSNSLSSITREAIILLSLHMNYQNKYILYLRLYWSDFEELYL